MDSMNMPTSPSVSSNSSMSSMSMSMSMPMMKMYFHFTPGDVLLFDTIVPSSGGAVFGACLVFFVISVFCRWFAAYCRGAEMRLSTSARRLALDRTDGEQVLGQGSVVKDNQSGQSVVLLDATPSSRFILSNELTRGVLTGAKETLHYLLMLVVMTFNASYIIAIIVGAVVGEVAFGRLHKM